MLRTCRKCGQEFPLTKRFFGHMPNGGYRYTCRQCVRANVRRHYYDDRYRSIQRTELRRDLMFSQAERDSLRPKLALRDGGFFCFYCEEPWTIHITSTTRFRSPAAASTNSPISLWLAFSVIRRSTTRTLRNTALGSAKMENQCAFEIGEKTDFLRNPG